jgi:predicted nucleotidyltransferase
VNGVERELRRIMAELAALERRFALVGGLAVSVRAEPRLTRDADLAVSVSDDPDAETVIRSLLARGYTVMAVVEQEAAGRMAAVRLSPPGDAATVTDLLFASSGIEPEIVESAERLVLVAGLEAPVATVGHLIALKLLARDDRHRPADADDLRALRAVAADQDWAVAAEAVALIGARGYARGRDLLVALDELRARGAYGDGG